MFENLNTDLPKSASSSAPVPTRLLKLSINPAIIDKNVTGNIAAFKSPWVPHELSIAELANHIQLGRAFSAQFKNQIRKGSNFLCADFLAIDVDGTTTLDEGFANEFIRAHGSLLYTTPSHLVGGKHRFRVVFITPATITSASIWSSALLGLHPVR